jgi:methionyl-tRNA formyltransferase
LKKSVALPNSQLDTIKVEGSGPLYEGVLAVCRRHGYRVVGEGPAALFVLANVSRIVKTAEFQAPPLGTLCFHPSVLPRHRGRDAVYWSIKMGDTETGVSWFWVTEKVDAGPIAAQRIIPMPEDIRPRDLYNQHLVGLGIEAFEEILLQLERGIVPRTEQDESLATYEPPRPRVKPAVEQAS